MRCNHVLLASLAWLCLVSLAPQEAAGFNVETTHYASYLGSENSMFGYSVAGYRDSSQRGWVIVGAPLNETNYLYRVERGGSVMRCDIAENNRCFPVKFDEGGTNYVKTRRGGPNSTEPVDFKSYQWFGATLATSMRDGGPVLACAPRYHWFGYFNQNSSAAELRDGVGACWIADPNNGSSSALEFSPCRNMNTSGHNGQGNCQAGSSAALSKDGQRVFVGAPGSWYWQGQVFTMRSNERLPFTPKKKAPYGHRDNGYLTYNVLATREGPSDQDDSYMGYSMTVGEFAGDGDAGIAVGVPRGQELYGNVMFFSSQLRNHRNISGEQMGAYFGYALAAGDFDGDRMDDLIVSAPYFTDPDNSEMKSIETGRIYVFYQGEDGNKFERYDTRDGRVNRGQFGKSIACLGDIDINGYDDFAVGEPYGGPENRGAVYIYHGSATGVEEEHSQVIYSEQLQRPISTFGWSLSGGLDLDGNHYPDLVVGAYESNTAVFFRSRPVINVDSEITFESEHIDLRNRTCVLSDGTAVACAELKVCCRYHGQGVWARHEFNMRIILDEKKRKNPRMFFLDLESKNSVNWSVTLNRDQPFCKSAKVYVAQNLRDKLTSLDAEMTLELIPSSSQPIRSRDPKRRLEPVLGPKNTKKRNALAIHKHCGTDDVCVPDLSLEVTKNVEKYLLGSNEKLELEVRIQNNAEDAFESMFHLALPAGIEYINIESQNGSHDVFVQCSAPKPANNNTLRCDVGNPLSQGKVVQFRIYLEPLTFHGMKPVYELQMNVTSTNPEKPYSLRNNRYDIFLPIWVETELFIEGESRPKDIFFNPYNFTDVKPGQNVSIHETEFGPVIVHNYTIKNHGPSEVLQVEATLVWPAETLAGDELMYLLEQPETSEQKIFCESANANYWSLVLDPRRSSYYHVPPPAVHKRPTEPYYPQGRPYSDSFDPYPEERVYSPGVETRGEQLDRLDDEYASPYTYPGAAQYDSPAPKYPAGRDSYYENSRGYPQRANRRRERRQSRNEFERASPGKQHQRTPPHEPPVDMNCRTAKCVNLRCEVGPLERDEEVWLAARYRVSARTLRKIANQDNVEVSTRLTAQVTSQPFIGKPSETLLRSDEVRTVLQSMPILPSSDVVPLWIVVLAASAGTAILLLLAYLLYRCGFFNRNRPTHTPERQPLRSRDY